MAQESLRRWGHPYPMTFTYAEYTDGNPQVVAVAAIASAPDCWIAFNLNPAEQGYFWGKSPDIQQRVMDHEIGHCLGLWHPPSEDTRPQVMNWATDTGLTLVDRANYRALWPDVRPYQVVVGPWAAD